tara:strand:- start:597 stop:1154 length:558 start_codon:yes stop_codon:yes gene_type:complete
MASALKAVGSNQTITTGTSPASTTAISQQTDTLRVVAESVGCHVAIGTNPTAATTDIYVGTSGGDEKISLGPVASQRVVGITTGAQTTLDFPEGTGSPFSVGDAVTLTTSGNQSYYDFSHKIVSSIDTSSGVGGFFSTRIVVNNDSSGIVTAFSGPYADLRRSFKVSLRTAAGSGKAFVQQVQVS